jgi:hypothetical protein
MSTFRWRFRHPTPLAVAVVVTAVYGLYVFWRLIVTGGDPSFFIVAGPPTTDSHGILPNLHVFPAATYDGQFFYRLALEPWTSVQTAYGIQLDLPAYRQQRILYPLIAWAISAGRWQLTPVALIIANLLAVGALAYASAAFAATLGRNAFASVLVPLYPGYVLTISRDLAELTEAALLATGLVLLERRRFWLATAALTAGMFAKETLLGVPIAGVILWAIRRARRRSDHGPPLRVWLVPLLTYAAWSVVMAIRWDASGMSQGYVNFGVPLDGLVQHLRALELATRWRAELVELGFLGLIAGVVTAVVATYHRRLFGTSVLPLACMLYAILALLYGAYIWQDNRAYPRALHELFLTAALALLAASVWFTRVLGLAAVVVWLAVAIQSGPVP